MVFFIAMFLTVMILFVIKGLVQAWWQSRKGRS